MPAFLLNLVIVSLAPVSVREARGCAWASGGLGAGRWGPQTPGAAACARSAEAVGSWEASWDPQAQETWCGSRKEHVFVWPFTEVTGKFH